MSMRRAKIRPSINLAASRPRRNVPTPGAASTDRSLKSPAKAVSSDRSLRSPAKAASSDRPLKSPSKTVQSPVKPAPSAAATQRVSRSSVSSETTPVSRQTSISKQSVDTSQKNAEVQNKQISEESARKNASPSKATSAPSGAEGKKQTDKQLSTSAPSAPKPSVRGRRKHAPNIPSRSRPPRQQVQQPTPSSESTSNSSDKAKETRVEKKQPGRSDATDLPNTTDGGAVAEPPPVQRVVDTADTPMPMPKATNAPEPRHTASKSSESQSFPIHRDAPVVSKTSSASVTKVTSTVTKATTTKSTSTPLRTIGPPEKRNPMNIYERKLRELKETLEEETPAKRRRRYVKKNMPSDRSNMTMSDLIYYNPKNNPMKQSSPGAENRERTRTSSEIVTDLNKDGSGEDDEDDDNVDQFAPQVKIGPDGELILDQKSLVKDASPRKTFDPSDSDVVHEDFSSTTYASFRKKTRTATWTKKETEKFYKALSAVGTDFSMINAMFPKRTRHQIKNKFKREERCNRHKVDSAIRKTSKVSMSMFVQSDEDSESETENRPAVVSTGKKSKKRHASGNSTTSTSNAQNQEGDTDSLVDERENTLIARLEDEEMPPSENGDDLSECPPTAQSRHESEDSEEDINMETILSRPTRSGRQPKMRTSFTIEEQPSTRVHARSKSAFRAKPVKPAKPSPSCQQQRSFIAGKNQTTPKTPDSQTFVTPTTTPRKGTSIQHIIINSPVTQTTSPMAPNPSPIKTHIYVINSPDGSQRIVQLPVGNTVPTPVRSNASSPIVIHRVQASQAQPASLNLQTTAPVQSVTAALQHVVATSQAGIHIVPTQSTLQNVITPSQRSIHIVPTQSSSQNNMTPSQRGIHIVPTQGVSPQRVVLNPQNATISPAVRSIASSLVTSSLPKPSPVKQFMVIPPKVQRRPLVSQNNTVINIAPRMTSQIDPQRQQQQVQYQQQQYIQLPSTSSDSVVLHQNIEGEVELVSDTVVAQQVDVECFDRMSDSGASDSGAFIPPVAGVKTVSGMEQNSDQLMITGLGSEGLSTRDIFEQISYEQGVGETGQGAVAANMTISEDMISQIATEIAIEKYPKVDYCVSIKQVE